MRYFSFSLSIILYLSTISPSLPPPPALAEQMLQMELYGDASGGNDYGVADTSGVTDATVVDNDDDGMKFITQNIFCHIIRPPAIIKKF